MTPEERAELAREEARIAERFAALEAERDAARAELAAFVPPGTLGAGETPALCGTCKDRLCVPGLPGCARCVKAGLAETTHALEVTGEKVTALRKQRDQAEAERDQARAELAAIHTTETDVTWLADGVRRLILGVSVRTAKDASAAQYTIAQEVASHINAGILTAFVSSRIVDLSVEYVRQAKAEQAKDTEQAVHAYFADADQRGIHLDGMTVDELCDAVMAAIREGTGQ